MKLFVRTLIILAAALIVAGATFAIAGQDSSASAGGRFPAQAELGQPSGEVRRGDFPGGEPRGGHAGGLFGAVEMLRSLAIIGVIVLVIAPLKRLLTKRLAAAPRRVALSGDVPDRS